MQFKSVLVAFSALAAVAVAAPAEAAKRDLGLYACTRPGLTGDCAELPSTDYGTCLNIVGYLHDGIDSLTLESTVYCQMYKDVNCEGDSITASSNDDNLQPYQDSLPVDWTDTISSYKCFPRA